MEFNPNSNKSQHAEKRMIESKSNDLNFITYGIKKKIYTKLMNGQRKIFP